MTKTLIRLVTAILVSGVMAAAAEPPPAVGPLVQILFTGTSVQPPGYTFTGCVQYDSSLHDQSPHYFDFTGSALNHEICYQTTNGLQGSGNMGGCEPYFVHTSMNADKTFQLTGTQPDTTTVVVTVPAATGVTFSATALPACAPGGPSLFQSSGTFTLSNANNGAAIFTGTINSVSCSEVAVGTHCNCATSGTRAQTIPVAHSPAPAPCPAYVCRPRPACCLTRLFARRNRNCW